MATITYIKFMTKEELVDTITKLRRFTMKVNGKTLVIDNRVNRPKYWTPIDWPENRKPICLHAPAFKLKSFDMEDCLICGSGYVRYNMDHVNRSSSGKVLESLGFVEEF